MESKKINDCIPVSWIPISLYGLHLINIRTKFPFKYIHSKFHKKEEINESNGNTKGAYIFRREWPKEGAKKQLSTDTFIASHLE